MEEAFVAVTGTLLGFLLASAAYRNQLRFVREDAKMRITEFKESFQKGFEAQNGFKPFEVENRENETLVMNDEVLYELERAKAPDSVDETMDDFDDSRPD